MKKISLLIICAFFTNLVNAQYKIYKKPFSVKAFSVSVGGEELYSEFNNKIDYWTNLKGNSTLNSHLDSGTNYFRATTLGGIIKSIATFQLNGFRGNDYFSFSLSNKSIDASGDYKHNYSDSKNSYPPPKDSGYYFINERLDFKSIQEYDMLDLGLGYSISTKKLLNTFKLHLGINYTLSMVFKNYEVSSQYEFLYYYKDERNQYETAFFTNKHQGSDGIYFNNFLFAKTGLDIFPLKNWAISTNAYYGFGNIKTYASSYSATSFRVECGLSYYINP